VILEPMVPVGERFAPDAYYERMGYTGRLKFENLHQSKSQLPSVVDVRTDDLSGEGGCRVLCIGARPPGYDQRIPIPKIRLVTTNGRGRAVPSSIHLL